jgi:ABC-type molybdenum transport system ATPase subunit/photorepair protein PhrA
MQSNRIVNECAVEQTPRLLQLCGMFDVPIEERCRKEWVVEIALPDKWNVGVIVGPSGSGKSTVAKALFGEHIIERFEWSETKSVVDGFPQSMSIKEICAILSSVGFSSPPSWVRPFAALSNGEQFRVHVARCLAESIEIAVVDEFTSVVDRTVAQIGSSAVAKAVRRAGKKFVAVTCHYDVLDWLEPDWVYEPHTNHFYAGRSLHRRPEIKLKIVQASKDSWVLFKNHHYLDASLSPLAKCFVAILNDVPVAFTSVLNFPHPSGSKWREHRTVCLPDYQGVGIGNALSEAIASAYKATGKNFTSTTSSHAMIQHRARSKKWEMTRKSGFTQKSSNNGKKKLMGRTMTNEATTRHTTGFKFIGESDMESARGFKLIC